MSPQQALLTFTLPSLVLAIGFGGCTPAERPRPVTTVEVIAPDETDVVLTEPLTPFVLPTYVASSSHAHAQPTPVVEETWFGLGTNEPAQRVLDRAEQMIEESVVVRGSCYGYIRAIFERAGYGDRRSRRVVFQASRRGPYADLDLLQPGDWLFIVNNPDARPMGTHSVLFLGWHDRVRSSARVVSYVGGQADRPAHLMTRDVSRTYTIARAQDTRDRTPPR